MGPRAVTGSRPSRTTLQLALVGDIMPKYALVRGMIGIVPLNDGLAAGLEFPVKDEVPRGENGRINLALKSEDLGQFVTAIGVLTSLCKRERIERFGSDGDAFAPAAMHVERFAVGSARGPDKPDRVAVKLTYKGGIETSMTLTVEDALAIGTALCRNAEAIASGQIRGSSKKN
jgi:hypothetical protein